MNNRNTEASQGDGGKPPPQPTPVVTSDQLRSRGGNKVYKSGPLFLSSKGIGWTSWKKRWFILTRTSLVFFRSDPSIVPQKGSEVNLTLGGIDLNSSGSVVVKADKKLLTVLFPDGRDGRAFTLKAETSEDLYEWKTALEEALANAPSAALAMGQNGIFRNNQADGTDGSSDQSKDRQPPKSFVIGRPVLLALEEIDGSPSFLEKALRFLEEYGVKVEGILRQAAAVDDVEHRIREYEEGKREFSPDEDAHVVADCIKFFLRELPSSPVPASCCKALLEACRADRGMKVTATRSAICETFPEPNRRLLQRILMMMQTVVSHKAETRMSTSAVAACMAPLLLRPLLAGECDLGGAFDMGGGDGSFQLLQAAAAANHAQAIVITLLEEYDNLFGEGSMSPELYSDSEDDGSESEEISDEYETYEDDDEYYDETEGSGSEIEEGYDDHSSRGTHSDTGESDGPHHKEQGSEGSKVAEVDKDLEANRRVSTNPPQTSSGKNDSSVEGKEKVTTRSNDGAAVVHNSDSGEVLRDDLTESSSKKTESNVTFNEKSISVPNGASRHTRQQTVWGRTPAMKNVPLEVDPSEEEAEIQKLEAMKSDLENRIAEESQINATLQGNLDKRRNALFERRQALEQEVTKLQEQLKKEKELRLALEAGLRFTQGALPSPPSIDEKTLLVKAEIEEIVQEEEEVNNLKQKADDLGVQLSQQREQNSSFTRDSFNESQQTRNQQGKLKDKQKESEATAPSRPSDRLAKKKTDLAKSLRQLPQNPQLDLSRITKAVGGTTNLISPDSSKALAAANKKSGARNEGGANSTTSALSKLTNRLNFLKERRTQLEQQKQERSGKESESSSQSLTKESESSSQSSEKGRTGTDVGLSLDNKGIDGSSLQNPEKYNKPDSQQNTDNKGKRNDTLSTANLDREKSESFPRGDKGRAANTGSAAPRTNSR